MDNSFIQHSVKVMQALNKQREEGRYCDATLAVGGLLFKAHWSILACSSQFFQSLYGDGTSDRIILHESFSEVMNLLLDFLYTGELAITEDNMGKVLLASKELCLVEAVEFCEKFEVKCFHASAQIEGYLTDYNVVEALQEHVKPPEESDGEDVVEVVSEIHPPLVHETTPLNCTLQNQGPTANTYFLHKVNRLSPSTTDVLKPTAEVKTCPESNELKRSTRRSKHDGGFRNEWELEVVQVHDVITDLNIHDEDYTPEKKTIHTKRKSSSLKKNTDLENTVSTGLRSRDFLANGKDPSQSVECPTCHKRFLSKYYLKVHNRKHTGEKPFKCSKCGKCYFRKDNLLEHEARNCVNKSEKAFTCSKCQEKFKRRLELQMHIVSHTGEMPYKCSPCSQQFMKKKDHQSHMIKLHGAPKPHACSTCGKSFLTRTELRLHEAFKHRGEKLFVCEECAHRASSRNGLQMHIKAKHRNERPHICEFCHHAFTQKANLTMHLRTHTGEKPFQCHLCGKTFRTQASLDKHNRTHTGERPFSCEFCNQKFTEKGPLVRHVASRHQEGRPHTCQICGKSFKAIEQLRVHVRRHKGMRKFECSECGYKFTRQAHLRRHIEIHNRMENYNPRQRKLRNLIIEEGKGLVIGLHSPHELEVGSAEVIVESLNPGSVEEGLSLPRLCADDHFTDTDVIDNSLISATSLPDDCET
ncbi:telomere zinc finger-associated protein [Ambystoma mexicanum]|uniref:telomere zinc finger-associated protein n=1 Tax=Ambystoma mexicanum TaxID=8296 RepID=UPI0037E93BCF